MKTVASTTFTSSSKQRKVNFSSCPLMRFKGNNGNSREDEFVLFYGLICKLEEQVRSV